MPRPPAADLAVSDRAATYIELLPTLPLESLRAIERALLSGLARPAPAELREARLGLLIDMLDQTGTVPRADDYDQVRAKHQARGERWPHSTTLIAAYGMWALAVRAAMRLLFDGTSARVAYTHARKGTHGDYTRDEIIEAVRRFHREHDGRWPRAQQFFDWASHLSRLAEHGGHRDPRLPSRTPVKRLFGGFPSALAAAQR